jgi:hypothetical protein
LWLLNCSKILTRLFTEMFMGIFNRKYGLFHWIFCNWRRHLKLFLVDYMLDKLLYSLMCLKNKFLHFLHQLLNWKIFMKEKYNRNNWIDIKESSANWFCRKNNLLSLLAIYPIKFYLFLLIFMISVRHSVIKGNSAVHFFTKKRRVLCSRLLNWA